MASGSETNGNNVVRLVGSDTAVGRLKVNVSAELPYESAVEILRIVRDGEAKIKAAEEKAAKAEAAARRKAEAAAAKAARAEAAQAADKSTASKKTPKRRR